MLYCWGCHQRKTNYTSLSYFCKAFVKIWKPLKIPPHLFVIIHFSVHYTASLSWWSIFLLLTHHTSPACSFLSLWWCNNHCHGHPHLGCGECYPAFLAEKICKNRTRQCYWLHLISFQHHLLYLCDFTVNKLNNSFLWLLFWIFIKNLCKVLVKLSEKRFISATENT